MFTFDSVIDRRRFVGVTAATAGVLGSGILTATDARAEALRETADLITGPFYPQVKPVDHDADMTMLRGHSRRAAGQVIKLSGRVLNVRGEPARHASMEVWQANAHGRYSHPSDPDIQLPLDPDFQGYARLRTDGAGRYRITTIKPGPYPTARGDMRAPHIHFQIDGAVDRKVTQLFFPGEPLNDQDRHLQSVRRPETILAEIAAGNGSVLMAHWDIVLSHG